MGDLSKRTRLAIATVVALGTASPLVLFSAPGAPSPSWVQAAQSQTPAEAPDPTTIPSITTIPAPTTSAAPTTRPWPTTTLVPTTKPVHPVPHNVVVTTTAPTRPSGGSIPPSGAPRPCTTADISVTVSTDKASYVPGDTVTITVAATNGGMDTCGLGDPSQTPPNGRTCQPQVFVYAPLDPAQGGIATTVANLNPVCSTTSIHNLSAGEAWRVTVAVPVPSSGSLWPAGTFRVDAQWFASPVWKSGGTTFAMMTSPAPASTPPALSV